MLLPFGKGELREATVVRKDMVVMEKYPNAEIHGLLGKQMSTKGEKITNNAIGFLTNAPFGMPEFLNGIKNADKEFYLVNQSGRQFFVIVTDEFIESRQLAERITDKKFSIGNFSFVDCGIIYGQRNENYWKNAYQKGDADFMVKVLMFILK